MILKQTPSPEKRKERERIQRDVEKFLEKGGEIKKIEKGESHDEHTGRWDAGKIKS